MMIVKIAFLLLCAMYLAESAEEGDPCSVGGVRGTCIIIGNCPSAIAGLKEQKYPQICSFVGTNPVVCCIGAAPTASTTTKKPVTIAPYEEEEEEDDECEAIPEGLTGEKTGQKAWDKCIEYQQALVYPCENAVSVGGGLSRQFHCHHNADELIVGGVDAAENEFPHMVLLGYGKDPNAVQWQCGGSLISEQWVLTAGHCTYDRNYKEVTFALVGALRRSERTGEQRRVARYINAPGYKQNSRYSDIALVMLDRQVKLTQFLVPACVHIGDAVDDTRVQAAGWGLTENLGNVSDILQKVILNKFTEEECSEFFPAGNRHLEWGLQDTQVCYGDKEKKRDTCQGDSGGPLSIKSKKLHCMYVVTAVTSFGKRCGALGTPAIYTRVAAYLDWIERTVWP